MRKIKYKKWNPKTTVVDQGFDTIIPAHWDEDFINEGLFHQWGLVWEETGSYSVALIESSDGVIHEIIPSNVQFI